MYAGIEEKFNSVLRERLDAANNHTIFLTSFSNYLVVSMLQNKSFKQLDVFLLILCFYRFSDSICGGTSRFSFAKSNINPSFADTERAGCGNETIFCLALIGCFRREMTSPDHLDR